jgi:nifR3 family TIM-barrel protein
MHSLDTPFSVGTLKLPNRTVLAPLAGVSDIPFRRICQDFGVSLTFVEMLSAKAINYRNKKTFDMMARHQSEAVLGVQLTGSNADDIAQAIGVLDGMSFDTIDLNMGCPVKKVTKVGCGSALLVDLDKLDEILARAREATAKPLSAKIRLGFEHALDNVAETSALIAKHKFDMLTIHGRFRTDRYAVPCNHAGIKKGLQAARELSENIVGLANGDIFKHQDAQEIMCNTQADAVMVSRGALGNPWVFRELLGNSSYQPSLQEWYEVIVRHLAYQEEHYGNTRLAAILMRENLLWYAKGFPGVKSLKAKLSLVDSLADAKDIISNFYKILSPKLLARIE